MKLTQQHIPFISILSLLVFLGSCSIQKYIPEGELLYIEGTVALASDTTLEDLDGLNEVLTEVLRPIPNKSFLGMYPSLYYHYKVEQGKAGFLTRWLDKKYGKSPVYLSDVKTSEVEKIVYNRLNNRGFFYSTIKTETKEKPKRKRASVRYNIALAKPFTMASYQLDSLGGRLNKDIQNIVNTSLFTKGMRFDLSALKTERERIDIELKNNGYYNFNAAFLSFEADTNQLDNKQFDLFLGLKKDVPKEAIVPYKVSKINVYPNYDLKNDSLEIAAFHLDGKDYFQKDLFFKPKLLSPFITLNNGAHYNPERSRNTARRLSSIGLYKFVNIQYVQIDSLLNDSIGTLEANIYLSPLPKRALRAELQAVAKSNNFAGPSLGLSYTNRNLFQGGEALNINTNVAYEFQLGNGGRTGLTSLVLGVKSDLTFPRIISPFNINTGAFKYAIPKTKIGAGAEFLSRSELYKLLSGTAQFGYLWNANRFVTHEIYPASINYTNLINTTEEFDAILADNPFLQSSFNQQFIAGLTYSFTYNGMVDAADKHQFYLNATLELTGNTIGLFAQQEAEKDSKSFLGLEYAQYAKLDFDIRYHLNMRNDQKLAARVFAGYGHAYGNSEVLPFIKQYFSGGPFSVRAFRIRSLGPGTFFGENNGNSSFFDQTGNIRLEANLEYRFPIFSYLKGAVFADAGNVWLSDENPSLPGGQFGSEFMSELGMGAGVGLRVDVQGFVIRFDFAAPFHDPRTDDKGIYRFSLDETLLNFAIGYPF